MKKRYFFLITLCTVAFNSFAQSDCSNAQAHIVYAFSHSESALDANNVTHAKHFAAKSKEAFERVQNYLKDCECNEVDDFVYDAINYLAKAESVDKLEDAYYYANKGKDLAQKTIYQLDLFTSGGEDVYVTSDVEIASDELNSIAYEQEQLKQQQLELERKQEAIQRKIAEQKTYELNLKKEKLILEMEQSVSNNLKVLNKALETCDCKTQPLNASLKKENLNAKSLGDIKLSFIGVMKELTSNYMKQLADCDDDEDND